MEHNDIVGIIPWPVALVTAVWFGMMALKTGKNAALWAIGGGALGLIVSTIVLGLAQAAFIPMVDTQVSSFRFKMTFVAILIVFCAGWLFAGSIHPRLFAMWKSQDDTLPGAQPVKPPGDIRKEP